MSGVNALRATMVVLGAALLGVSSAMAQSSLPDPAAWVTDGPVYAVIHSGTTTYLGGEFTYVGPNTGYGVPLSAASAAPVATYPRVNGPVFAAVADGSGGWYIGGAFTQVGSASRQGIAHILPNGTVDGAWNPKANHEVHALAVSGDGTTVYVGGQFTSIGGQARQGIAALDAATGLATAWNPNADDYVWALAVSGTTVYVGGTFWSIGGELRNGIAALDATTGLATAWNPTSDTEDYSATFALALSGDGATVYAGGGLMRFGGQERNSIAALDAATGLATTWNPDADDFVYAIAVSGATVYVGGDFTSIGGQTRSRIAGLNATTGLATAWNPDASGGAYPSVSTLAVSGATVYAGGHFTSIGGQARNHIAALAAATGLATAWNPYAGTDLDSSEIPGVYTVALAGTTVYAGGVFMSIGGQMRNYIAALDAAGALTGWNPDADSVVYDLAVLGTNVYAAGNFWTIGGQARNNIAAINATTGLATAWNPDAQGDYHDVYTLAASGSTVYAGGDFTTIGGQPRNRIAAIDTTTGLATAWNPDADAEPLALAVSGGTIYAAGWFSTIGGQPRDCIAALDATTGLATAWNPGADLAPVALAVSGSTVYVGGQFTLIGGQPRNAIAALDATTGLATNWNPNADGLIYSLAVSGSTVYAGGDFTAIGGQTRNYIAALNATTGLATLWNPNAGGNLPYVEAVAVSGTTVYVGGRFTSMGESLQSYYAQFDLIPDPPTALMALDDPSPTDLDTVHFSVDFSKPLVTPLTNSDVALTPGSLAGTIVVSGSDPDYTVSVALANAGADGTVAITIPAGAVSDIDGIAYAGGTSPAYTIHNGALPVAGGAGIAMLLGTLAIAGVRTMRRK